MSAHVPAFGRRSQRAPQRALHATLMLCALVLAGCKGGDGEAKAKSGEESKGPDAVRDAHFTCALALAWPDGHVEAFDGRVDGRLVWPPRGNKGFGYDPLFMPLGHAITFAEMDAAHKNRISHRADAFGKLVACFDRT